MCVIGSFSCWGNSLQSIQSDATSEEYKFSKGKALSLGSAVVQSQNSLLGFELIVFPRLTNCLQQVYIVYWVNATYIT